MPMRGVRLLVSAVGILSAAAKTGTTNVCGAADSNFAIRTTPVCAADFNQSGIISVQNIFDFLAAYFAGCP